ncbi:MAG TPA: cysteine desulfurase [Xanthobacteraceae bacterium]|nr:cysteine desulfurase [Xanthobacteraceae bacterium]
MQSSTKAFDAAALKRQVPGLADPGLHYLDNAATGQMPEVVLEALRRFEIEARANVHEGLHRRARAATAAFDAARASVARFLNAGSDEVVFTYGATSSINLVAHAFGELLSAGDEILVSVLEHHSNLVPWQQLAARRGLMLRVLPMTPDGRLDLACLPSLLTERCRLVALTHASNVTGAVTNVGRVVAAAHALGAKVLLDGAQRAPHGPLDLHALGVDFYAFSGHKTYGPTGVGVLWGRRDLLAAMPPFMTGGQMIDTVTTTTATFRPPPRRFEAGTPPIAQAIGLAAALDWMRELDWRAVEIHEARLTGRLLAGLAALPGVRVLGPTDARARLGVVTFTIEGLDAADICRALDGRGVALRGGHHCAQPLMQAFGVTGAARASIAPYTLDADIDALLDGLERLIRAGARPSMSVRSKERAARA